jgi:16S rRNA (guanine966-N2)-methyltransferase
MRIIAGDEPVIAFIDPPWRFHEERGEKVRTLISRLISFLPAHSSLMIEARRSFDSEILPESELWDVRRYGGTQIAIRTLSEPMAAVLSEGSLADGDA